MAQTDERIPRCYARAFLATVLEMKGEEGATAVEPQLAAVAQLIRDEVGTFLTSPVFPTDEKIAVLDDLTAKLQLEPAVGRLVRLLVMERQLKLLPAIAAEYAEALREHRNEARAQVRTAFPLKPAEETRLAKALGRATGKKVLMKVEVDPRLIGGVVAEISGTVYDASISGFLQRLKEEFAV
ncbi:MAG: ATP synthase F1 subunit delta [Pseudomonadota bacterium]